MSTDIIRGCGTALVTPFDGDGGIDEAAIRGLVDWQIEQGVHFLVPCGSTGEAATMSVDEHLRVVSIVVEQVDGRVPVVAGAGGNNTSVAIALTRQVEAAGASHLLHVTPAYNRPPQRGLVAHFSAIADAASRPIVLYNVPGRTACNMEAETTLELAEHENIISVKEASASADRVSEIIRHRPDGFTVLSGDDSLTLPFMALGAEGVISVISNAVPAAMSGLVEALAEGDHVRGERLHYAMLPLMGDAFIESNPIPIKFALSHLGRIQEGLRLPLVTLAPEHRASVISALEHVQDPS
jgi:4-hydroxy-tetrahydrodipicolinate synthase